jgi:uncharacterized protein (TIGR02611 family)
MSQDVYVAPRHEAHSSQYTMRTIVRWSRIIIGFTLLALGLALLVLPGPGWLTLAAGLALLAAEFAWARTLLDRMKRTGKRVLSRRTTVSTGGDGPVTKDQKTG